jgi:hypothetical protein
VSSSGSTGGRRANRVRLQRQVVDRQVRRRKGQRRVQVAPQRRQVLPGQRVHQVEVEGVEGFGGLLDRGACLGASCTRPMRRSAASSKLCTPIDSRVTPAARKARKRSRSKVPGLASSVTSQARRQRQVGAQVGQQAVDALGAEQAGRAAADEDAVHRPAPDQGQRGFEIGAQGIEVARFGQVALRLV